VFLIIYSREMETSSDESDLDDIPKIRLYRPRVDPLALRLTAVTFKRLFRFPPDLVMELADLLRTRLHHPTHRGYSV